MDGKLIESINGPLYCIFYNVEEPVQEFGAIKKTFGWSPPVAMYYCRDDTQKYMNIYGFS